MVIISLKIVYLIICSDEGDAYVEPLVTWLKRFDGGRLRSFGCLLYSLGTTSRIPDHLMHIFACVREKCSSG